MRHLDLFSGIGGFALAVDTVWPNSEHIFVEYDPYCQQVLKKHWPEAQLYGDIRTFTNTKGIRAQGGDELKRYTQSEQVYIVTGGFPCQPFSQAGRRKGTADDRYLWPEMFRVIREWKPTWVIAENVSGLVTWNEGMVLEQVCADLENEGYEVQPFIIPAVSVNAPHRRDRAWVVANRKGERLEGGSGFESAKHGDSRYSAGSGWSWDQDWIEVATRLCGVDDGLPAELDGLKLTKAGHRRERLKALGNAIVPQVAIEIMKAIRRGEE